MLDGEIGIVANVTSEEKEDKPRIGLSRGADFPFVLSLYKLTNVKHLGHFTVRGTEESNLPQVPQPRLVLNTENGRWSNK